MNADSIVLFNSFQLKCLRLMMKTNILVLLAATSTTFALPTLDPLPANANSSTCIADFIPYLNPDSPLPPPITLAEVNALLHQEAPTLNANVINKVLTTLTCANKYNVDHNDILTVIDYSLPSSAKRLWIFDLQEKKLLFHTYVSHGIKSGVLSSTYFSNRNNSKASSVGVYKTDQIYYGRHGLSLKLDGLERGFNDNASNRSVVMHGGWYVEEEFIKKYGRAGRSWGCPAVPDDLHASIINTIKNHSLFVMYYPNDHWFSTSKFLRCNTGAAHTASLTERTFIPVENEVRDDILYADIHHSNRLHENDPIVVISAGDYQRIFQRTAPLERMLRRQINNEEYVAISDTEFKRMLTPTDPTQKIDHDRDLNALNFVIPQIKMVRGYYETQMKLVNMGKIKEITLNTSASKTIGPIACYSAHRENKPLLDLKPTHQFIRWVGL